MAKTAGAGVGDAAAKWAERVEALRQSGLSIRKYAAREGLRAGTLSFWKAKLERHGHSQVPRVAPMKFVELMAAPPGSRAPAAQFEIVLRSGATVRVPGGFDGIDLARLVAVLEEVRT